MNTLFYFLLATISSVTLALLEIQIEGKNGWASQLPTWKKNFSWIKHLPGLNRPLTGYHFFLWLFLFIYPHFIFIYFPWSFHTELALISFVTLVTLLEDFFWFILNPHFKLTKFKPQFIPWHPTWFGPLPITYWLGIIFWILLFLVSTRSHF